MKYFLPALCFFLAAFSHRVVQAQFSVNGLEMVCAGTPATLTAVNCAGTLQWSTGATTASVTVTPTASTLYTVTCTENGGDPKKANHSVGVFPKPSLTASTPNLCANENVTLRTNSTEFTHSNIIWKRDGQPIVAVDGAYVANQAGIYTVEDVVTPGVWVPYPSAPAGGVYRTFSFINDNHGWSVAGRKDLLKTEDGGLNWFKPAYSLNLATGDSLVDVAFTDATTGWTCAGGKIFKTSDGGVTWVSQYADSSLFLHDLFFLDGQRGWAAGRFGVYGSEFQYESTVLRTTDGGTTWQRANPLLGNAIFTDVQFISATVGWGISNAFDSYNGFPYDGTLMKSTDGGITWNAQISNAFSGPLSYVHFQDANNGWVGGSSFLANTKDGGSTWSYSHQIGGPFSNYIGFPYAIHFTGAVGWVLDGSRAYFTTDGGQSWGISYNQSGPFYYTNAAFLPSGKILAAGSTGSLTKFLPKIQSCISSITILPVPPAPKVIPSTTVALCAGESITLAASGCAGALSWSTGSTTSAITVMPSSTTSYTAFCAGTNGCRSTAYAGVAVVPKARLDTTSAAPCFRPVLTASGVWPGMDLLWEKDGQPLAYRDTKPYLPRSSGTFTAAVDAAGGWRPQTASRSSTFQEPGYSIDNLKDVQFVNDSTGFIVGSKKQFLRTTDGGKNWIASKIPAFGDRYDSYRLSFINADQGWIIGSYDDMEWYGEVLRTTDGGISWGSSLLGSPGSGIFFEDVFFVKTPYGGPVGWIVGYDGKLIKSGDGGYTWQPQNSNTTAALRTAFFLNDQTGWVGGDNGTLLSTTNGGATWTPRSFANIFSFRSIHFLDSTHGWATSPGPGNSLYRTTDGGTSWTQVIVDPNYEVSLNQVQFLNDSAGFVQSEKFVHATTDGGATWKKSYHHKNAVGMSFTDATHGWVVGSGIMTYVPAPPTCASAPVTVLPFAEVPLSTLASGNWNAPALWSCGTIPTALDAVVIDAAHTVTLPESYSAKAKSVELRGQIQYSANAGLRVGQD